MPVRDGSSTRVIACLGGGRTNLEARPRPRPGRGEMVLSLRASGLCGTDLFKLAHGKDTPGLVLGHELVGAVEEVGQGANGFQPGDRVVVSHHVPCGECPLCVRGSETLCPTFRENLLAPGGFSEHVLIRERAVLHAARKLPASVHDEAAVFLEPAACVLRGVRRAGLPSLDRPGAPARSGAKPPCAVVLGAGSMGLLHLLVLRAVEPGLAVLMADQLEDRLQLAGRLGAAAALPPERIGEAVRKATGGLGADCVFDTVGGSRPLELALSLAREGGTVVLFAHAPEAERAGFDLNDLFKHERRIVGTYSSTPAEQDAVYDLITSGRLDASPLVTHRLPLSRFQEGVELSRARRALKVLLLPEH